jgi:hypothetical protein
LINEKKLAELNQTTGNEAGASQNASSIVERFARFKKEAFTSLNHALSLDTEMTQTAGHATDNSQLDTVILAYEASYSLVERAVHFYEANMRVLERENESRAINAQLTAIGAQTSERLAVLKSERLTAANRSLIQQIAKSKSAFQLSDHDFLTIGDEILNDDDCIIIDDVANTVPSATKSPLQDKIKDFKKATEVVRIDDGVQLFYIADDGTVSTPSYPTTMSVYAFDNDNNSAAGSSNGSANVVGFVRVGSWLYPLTPNESPAMKTNFNAYIFPNKDQEEVNGKMNCFVGITFSSKVTAEERSFFEDVLGSYSALLFQELLANPQQYVHFFRPIIKYFRNKWKHNQKFENHKQKIFCKCGNSQTKNL